MLHNFLIQQKDSTGLIEMACPNGDQALEWAWILESAVDGQRAAEERERKAGEKVEAKAREQKQQQDLFALV